VNEAPDPFALILSQVDRDLAALEHIRRTRDGADQERLTHKIEGVRLARSRVERVRDDLLEEVSQ
jgi:hypothetical protein